jgi:small-conductance mechanosensitive channel
MPYWHRLAIVGGVLLLTAAVSWLIDRRIARRGGLPPETATRYRILRRSIVTTIVFVGVLSALLVIPEVRTVAGGILASSAVLGLIIGFASQRTIGNFVAGLMIAFTQPVRLGDRVEVDNVKGTVEEIGSTYTFIRTDDNARLVIPNEKLASDTIRNSTIRSREKLAEITVQIPIESDLRAAVDLLRAEADTMREGEVFVSDLGERATITMRAWATDEIEADRLGAELRLRAHERLRAAGVLA